MTMTEFEHHFRAMGTEVGLWLWSRHEPQARQALADIEQFFAQTEARLSRFQPESELSQLNRSAGRPFAASPLLFELVETALAWRERTAGIFDPTVLKALMAYGYDRSFEQIGERLNRDNISAPTISSLKPVQVKLNRAEQTITLPPEGGLDLGGIAKGWAVQQAAQRLGQHGPALVDAGGDIACIDRPPSGSPWLVGLADPHRPEIDLATLTLRNEAVATSSIARRRWRHQGTDAHHLIDPRTSAPALTDLVSVTVIGPALPAAEIHAKVTLILGQEQGLAYLAAQPALSALLVTSDDRHLLYGSFEKKAYVYSTNFANTFINWV
ncbi:MAG: FAD:protein FMN transferase [Anaerolineaceae bacterium]|nr:FAD:protein FMN transferase [Anaerolineaceae bacterium]MCB9099764.1 FAD:protein FMN transferase [Anaerolineales bacterium]